MEYIFLFVLVLLMILLCFLVYKILNNINFKNNKRIVQRKCLEYNEIPYNKSIYYTFGIMWANSNEISKYRILGTILLKWNNDEMINFSFKKNNRKEIMFFDLYNVNDLVFENKYEKKLYQIMYRLSNRGILSSGKLRFWFKIHFISTFLLFEGIKKYSIGLLKKEGLISKRKDLIFNNTYFVVNDVVYNDLMKLYGFKKYIIENKKNLTKKQIEDKNIILFAYILGISFNTKFCQGINDILRSSKIIDKFLDGETGYTNTSDIIMNLKLDD